MLSDVCCRLKSSNYTLLGDSYVKIYGVVWLSVISKGRHFVNESFLWIDSCKMGINFDVLVHPTFHTWTVWPVSVSKRLEVIKCNMNTLACPCPSLLTLHLSPLNDVRAAACVRGMKGVCVHTNSPTQPLKYTHTHGSRVCVLQGLGRAISFDHRIVNRVWFWCLYANLCKTMSGYAIKRMLNILSKLLDHVIWNIIYHYVIFHGTHV